MIMALFSERYGYTKPSDVIIRERITSEIQNAILTCFDDLHITFVKYQYNMVYYQMDEYVWTYFLNLRKSTWNSKFHIITTFIGEEKNEWFKKLDLIEFCVKYLYATAENRHNQRILQITKSFEQQLQHNFKRLNFAYRIINKEIVEISSEEEINEIETALKTSKDNIKTHLNNALELYSRRPTADYRNSIKESTSAVEVFCREKTGEETLGKALNKLESKGIIIHKLLKSAFDKLYAYTNQPDTGVRHALMDDDGDYVPQAEEALFMLVSCSAFINYLNKKIK